MKELKGSEKQIAWAEKIRKSMIKDYQSLIDDDIESGDEPNKNDVTIVNFFNNCDDAAMVIKMRFDREKDIPVMTQWLNENN